MSERLLTEASSDKVSILIAAAYAPQPSYDSLCCTAIDDSPDAVCVFDERGFLQRVSRVGALLVGALPEEMVGSSILDYLPWDLRDPLDRVLLGVTTLGEHLYQQHSGEPIWLHTRWQPLRDGGGKVIGGMLVAHDITAEKNEAHFRNYIETSPIAAAQSTPDGKLIFASPACAAMFGYASPEEMIAVVDRSSIAEALWLESPQRSSLVKVALAAGDHWVSSRVRGKRKDGSEFVFLLHLCNRFDAATKEPYLFSFLQDVTGELTAQEELERTGEILSEAESLAGFGGWEWDVRSDCVQASRGAQAILGVDRHDMSLEEFRSRFVHPDDQEAITRAISLLAGRGGKKTVELRIVRPDTKEVRHVVIYGRSVRREHGHPIRMRGAILDVTERVRAMEALNEKKAHLRRALTGAIEALSATVEMRDPYTAGHERRVATLACAIARRLGWEEDEVWDLWTAALLHDVGKLAIPAELLSKPGRLTKTEFQLIMTHAEAGRDILAPIDFGAPIGDIVAQHHERIDGSGYPQGLTGEAMHPAARILAVADVVEAMMSHRPYRPALPVSEAIAEIEAGAGVRYDAQAAAACVALLTDGSFTIEEE
jgi:PAS domain S-box-containing protein/putative nucleotidyltransferase with HDIG domain